MKTKPSKQRVTKRKIYLYKKANTKELKQEIKTLGDKIVQQISCTPNEQSVDEIWCTFKDGFQKAMDTHIPSKMASKKHQTPWINQSIKEHTIKLKNPSFPKTGKTSRNRENVFRKRLGNPIGNMLDLPVLNPQRNSGAS
jgi:hypothetical protein